ncbi:MAG: hypothetical protein Q4B99_02850 [Clostridia bacterium]|nr:hypothetical protein [Clostridia bacterium]
MFITQWTYGMMDFDDVKRLRTLRAGALGVPPELEFDWFDTIAAHLRVMHDGAGAAVARMYPDGGLTRIDRLFCDKTYEREGYYELMLRLMLYKAQTLAGEQIACAVPAAERALYERFGLRQHGGEYDVATVPHVELRVPRDGITWFSMCAHD